MIKNKTFNFSMPEESECPEERFDLRDGGPYREFNALPPVSAKPEVDPLEQHRAADIRDCCHRIRGDWCRNLNSTRVEKENESNEVTHEEKDSRGEESEQSADQIDIGVGILMCFACVCVFTHSHIHKHN